MEDLKLLTTEELMFLGLQKLAYVRAIKDNGEDIFAVYAADGTEIANVRNESEAVALIIKNALHQVTVH